MSQCCSYGCAQLLPKRFIKSSEVSHSRILKKGLKSTRLSLPPKLKVAASVDNSPGNNLPGEDSKLSKKSYPEATDKDVFGSGVLPEIDPAMENLLSDQESQTLMQDLSAAVERVKKARAALDELAVQEKIALETRFAINAKASVEAEQAIADALVSDMEEEVSLAEMAVQEAEKALVMARAGITYDENISNSRDTDRLESVKAGAISAIAGGLASIAFVYFSSSGEILDVAVKEGAILVSCALFGITYRYVVRNDLDNVFLKSGAVGAFGLVRGIALLEGAQPFSDLESFLKCFLGVGESIIVIALAAMALDLCMRGNLLMPFSDPDSP